MISNSDKFFYMSLGSAIGMSIAVLIITISSNTKADGIKQMESEVVKRGLAEYVVDQETQRVTFEWTDSEN